MDYNNITIIIRVVLGLLVIALIFVLLSKKKEGYIEKVSNPTFNIGTGWLERSHKNAQEIPTIKSKLGISTLSGSKEIAAVLD